MQERNALLIDGNVVAPHSDRRIDVISPSTEQAIGRAPDADEQDVEAAVRAARASLERGDWCQLPIAERAEVIDRALSALETNAADIASLVTAEMGMPIALSSYFIPGAFAVGRYFTAIAREVDIDELRAGMQPALVRREPVGVVAAIGPWNGPFNLAVNKIVPALLAGCSVVFKPAPETPFDVFHLADALTQAGVPKGVINVITGGRETGAALVAHAGIDKVTFTGSSAVGQQIGEVCGRSFKRMQLELGGKSAAIILEDADLLTTMTGLAAGCFVNSGQVCASFSRVLVPRSRQDEIVASLYELAGSFTIGDPFDPTTTHGPLVSERQRSGWRPTSRAAATTARRSWSAADGPLTYQLGGTSSPRCSPARRTTCGSVVRRSLDRSLP